MEETSMRQEGGRAPRVLVVDDDDPLREALCELLQQKGFVVVGQASNGPQAVTLAQENNPDVVLIDFRMPGMDGLEATTLIKARSPITQAIMFTAYEDPTLSLEAAQTDVYCLIVKGCRPELLLDMLRRAADLKRELESRAS
jgi:DNA-binding NarL/FixJ family response regulator